MTDSSITIRFYLAFLEQWEKLQTPRSTPRLPAQLICRAVRYVLEEDNACKFRGYVLDGFPRTAEEAHELFMTPSEGDEEVEGQNEDDGAPRKFAIRCWDRASSNGGLRLIVNDAIRPAWAFLLDSNLESCRRKEIESHGEVTVLDALNGVLDGQMVCREIRVDGVDADDVVDIMAQCIEYDGCPYNYLPSKRDEVESKTIEMEHEELRRKEAETRVREEALAKEAAEIEIRRCAEADRLKQVRDNEQQILEKYSRSLRDYLLDNVVPVLREGIIEACEKTPEDAVSFLAESVELTESPYLFHRSVTAGEGKKPAEDSSMESRRFGKGKLIKRVSHLLGDYWSGLMIFGRIVYLMHCITMLILHIEIIRSPPA
ncbi:conserved hypothetical protein [Perkinsus marinus ATCC 50983]|uniref:Adenylate kinase n=1 Tax=Perkinsus marinus (strain ATCC 50983 / TXsc) TaxID=423536 RepID=C5KAD1_PERM5|nr:conserved hypothetical protein [Perkinsus marinus ATCC 50983]EER18592.1 conserved hypothetical protein [Perkinsus marinus ATCC 50983]|eukprot:XP_002786796.1 conserved hypothetical protein [Perkinsus marinus ATCC 50983]